MSKQSSSPFTRLPYVSRAVLAACAVVALAGTAGCGVKDKKVATPAATSTTAKAATTTSTSVASDTADTSDSADSADSADSYDSYDSSDTSDSSDSSDSGTDTTWPAALRSQILASCKSALASSGTNLGGPDTCACVVRALEKKYSFRDIANIDSGSSSALTEASKQATIDCISDPTSH